MRINLLAAGLMALLIGPAVAAEEFFVVQNPETKNCKISNSKDDGQHLLIGMSASAGSPPKTTQGNRHAVVGQAVAAD